MIARPRAAARPRRRGDRIKMLFAAVHESAYGPIVLQNSLLHCERAIIESGLSVL